MCNVQVLLRTHQPSKVGQFYDNPQNEGFSSVATVYSGLLHFRLKTEQGEDVDISDAAFAGESTCTWSSPRCLLLPDATIRPAPSLLPWASV